MQKLHVNGIICLLCSVLLLSGCSNPTPAATPEPTATPIPATATPVPPTATPLPPTATPEPSATPTVEPAPPPAPGVSLPDDWVAFSDEARGLVIHHPAPWDVTRPDADKLAELFAQAGDSVASQSLQVILRRLTTTPGALDLFAALGFLFDDPTIDNNKFVSNFTAIVTPAEGLTLDAYVALVGAQLGSLDTVSMQSAQVESGLRPGGLDVASLRYTVDGAAIYGLPDGAQIDGWQVALYDTGAERLLILSLTAADENFPALEEVFREMIYRLTFE